jgi:RHS repeat-associated protein
MFTTGSMNNDFRFTGEQVDPETGLIYLRARYYEPETGRFISKDPFTGFASVPSSLNRYTYVKNNPVLYTDPSGKVAYLAPAVIGAVVNDGWYLVVDVGIQHQQFSWVTLGGRTAGGAAGGVAGAVAISTGNPYIIGAAAGGTSYAVDRWTQGQLSNLGVSGTREDFTWEGFGFATGGGAVMGKATDMAIPFSPTNTNTERFARNGISKAGMWGIGIGINNFPPCQGPPIRLHGDGSLNLPGMGKK